MVVGATGCTTVAGMTVVVGGPDGAASSDALADGSPGSMGLDLIVVAGAASASGAIGNSSVASPPAASIPSHQPRRGVHILRLLAAALGRSAGAIT